MSDRVVRIACGQGFWGDRPEAPLEQVTRGPVDYVVMDYLAEVTMSILQKARSRDPGQGYARDFISVLRDILPVCAERGIRVVSNAGGVNLAPAATRRSRPRARWAWQDRCGWAPSTATTFSSDCRR